MENLHSLQITKTENNQEYIDNIENLYARITEAETDLEEFVKKYFKHLHRKVGYLRSPAYITGVVAFKFHICPSDFEQFGKGFYRPKAGTKAFKDLLEVNSIHINQWAIASGIEGAKSIIDEIGYYYVQL